MKRLLVLLCAIALVVPINFALADEGAETDANNVNFNIKISSGDTDPVTGLVIKDTTSFTVTSSPQNSRDGWDFGDRIGYKCGYVEHFTGGAEDFSVHYQIIDPYPVEVSGTPQINDTNGHENQPTALCGPSGVPGQGGGVTFDDTDHFPHGTTFEFYRTSTMTQFDSIDYTITTCGTHYWVAGDEPGEAWLWIDPDGAMDLEEHGDGLCGGGEGEPYASARAHVKTLASGVGVCVTNVMDVGKLCTDNLKPTVTSFDPTSGPASTSVTLTGTKFTGATAVSFNGTSASFTVNSATSITATVPAGATDGPITVTTDFGSGTSAGSFDVQTATQVELGSGLSELVCPDESTPAVESTDPLIVSCP